MAITAFSLLDQEWPTVIRNRRARLTFTEWATSAAVLAEIGCIERLEPAIRSADPTTADEILLALLRRAPTDALAARLVLGLLSPGAKRLARLMGQLGDADEVASAVVAALFERICTYPVDRRPNRVAANLLLDTRMALTRRRHRSVTATEVLDDNMPAGEATSDTPVEQLLGLLIEARRRGTLAAEEATLIACTRIGGVAIASMAEELGCHSGSLRRRRLEAEQLLARSVAA